MLVVSPYFVSGKLMMKQFADLRQRGMRIRVQTNSRASTDAPAAHVHVHYARYRQELLGMGIEMYEMRAGQEGSVSSFGSAAGPGGGSRASLHAKVVVVMGRRLLVVGSMKLDLRAKLQDSEVALTQGAWRVERMDGQLVWRAPQGSQLKDATTEPDASVGLRRMLTTRSGAPGLVVFGDDF